MDNLISLSEPHHSGAKNSTTHWAALRVTAGNAGEAPDKLFVRSSPFPRWSTGPLLYHVLPSVPLDQARGTSLQNHCWVFLPLFHSSTGHWTHELIQLLTFLDVMNHVMAFSLVPTPPPQPTMPPALPMENRRDLGSQSGVTRWDLAWLPALRCLAKDYLILGISLRE